MFRTIDKKITHLSVLFVIFALVLAACSPAAPGPAPAANNPIPVTGATPTPALAVPTAASSPSAAPAATSAPVQPPAGNGPVVMLSSKSGLGSFLVDSKGMTLYIFKSDTPGVSNCGADCIGDWPALTATGNLTAGPGVTGTLGLIKRPDGTQQVTYNGLPLYYFVADSKPGDTTGQDLEGFIVAPLTASQPAQSTQPPANSPAPSGGGYGGGY